MSSKMLGRVLIVTLLVTNFAVSQETAKTTNVYTDTKNGYFMFLPPKGWTPQLYDDPRTKVAFNHPSDPGVFIRFIVREAPGETFEAMINEDKKISNQMRNRGISCEVKESDINGLKCSEVNAQFPNNAGMMMLRKFLSCGLHFNIQYSAPTKALFDKHFDEAMKSLETITVLKVTGGDVIKAREQQIANRVRLAKLTAQWVSVEEARQILKEAKKEFPESTMIQDALKEMTLQTASDKGPQKFGPADFEGLYGKKVKWAGSVTKLETDGCTCTVLLSSKEDDRGHKTLYVVSLPVPRDIPALPQRGDTVVFEGILQEGVIVKEKGFWKDYFDKVVTEKTITLLLSEPKILSITTAETVMQEVKEIILEDIKPTLTGYTNTAFVETDKVGEEKKEMTVFRRNKDVSGPLVAAKGGAIWGDEVAFEIGRQGEKKLSGDAHIAIDGDTQFTGNLDYAESTYTFLGTVRLMKHVFSSDEKNPLVFKLVKDKGFMHVKGSGKVSLPDGNILTIPSKEAKPMAELVISFKDMQPDPDSTLNADVVKVFKGGVWVFATDIPPRDIDSTVKVTCGNEIVVLTEPTITFEGKTSMMFEYKSCKVFPASNIQKKTVNSASLKLLSACKAQDSRIFIKYNLGKDNEWVIKSREPISVPAEKE